jgi:hypothetical protein
MGSEHCTGEGIQLCPTHQELSRSGDRDEAAQVEARVATNIGMCQSVATQPASHCEHAPQVGSIRLDPYWISTGLTSRPNTDRCCSDTRGDWVATLAILGLEWRCLPYWGWSGGACHIGVGVAVLAI